MRKSKSYTGKQIQHGGASNRGAHFFSEKDLTKKRELRLAFFFFWTAFRPFPSLSPAAAWRARAMAANACHPRPIAAAQTTACGFLFFFGDHTAKRKKKRNSDGGRNSARRPWPAFFFLFRLHCGAMNKSNDPPLLSPAFSHCARAEMILLQLCDCDLFGCYDADRIPTLFATCVRAVANFGRVLRRVRSRWRCGPMLLDADGAEHMYIPTSSDRGRGPTPARSPTLKRVGRRVAFRLMALQMARSNMRSVWARGVGDPVGMARPSRPSPLAIRVRNRQPGVAQLGLAGGESAEPGELEVWAGGCAFRSGASFAAMPTTTTRRCVAVTGWMEPRSVRHVWGSDIYFVIYGDADFMVRVASS
jgi:hypothetical protein